MAFIFVIVFGILMVNNAVSAGIPQCRKVFHQANDNPHPVSSTPIKINLTDAGVFDGAIEVVVYAKIVTGYIYKGAGKEGTLFVRLLDTNSAIQDTRNLFYKIYQQSALSYNSENIQFPVISGLSKAVEAGLNGPTHRRVQGTVQIVGYYTVQCL